MSPSFATTLQPICNVYGPWEIGGKFAVFSHDIYTKKSPLPNKSGLVTAGEKAPVLVLYTDFAPEAIQIVLISLA